MIADFDGDISTIFNKHTDDELPMLITRNLVVFPGVLTPIIIGRKQSLELINAIKGNEEKLFAVFAQRDASIEMPGEQDIFEQGVFARLVRLIDMPGPGENITAIVQGLGRCTRKDITKTRPYHMGHAVLSPEELPAKGDKEFKTAHEDLLINVKNFVNMNEDIPDEMLFALKNIHNEVLSVNYICMTLTFSIEDKESLLNTSSIKDRVMLALKLLYREEQLQRIKQDIRMKTREDLDEQQREYFLQQQIKNIKEELGNGEGSPERKELLEQGMMKKWNKATLKYFMKELDKLDTLNPQSPDYSQQLNYLRTLVNLPWNEYTTDNLDLKRAQRILDHDHYGMEKVKERILEYMAVLKLRGDLKSPIICLYGPPGVGKTSLGKSIASAMKRKYVRMSLGGLHDESEIRGHRRTYIGAMPGRIIKNIQKAGSSNPVFILDEIDKVTQNTINGDPSSALLEVLDPEQNNAFHDNYLDVDYDLSKVLFIATANDLNTIPRPLLDRMEIIEVSGYITEEKIEIAKRHLIPRELENTGLDNLQKDAPEAEVETETMDMFGTPVTVEKPKKKNFVEKMLHRADTWKSRIDNFTDTKIVAPEDFDLDKDAQEAHANIAIVSSNYIGKGPGNSVERDFLAQAFSDFIFAIIIEEMGIFGAAFVVLLYIILLFRAARIANRCENNFPAFLVMGLALLLVTQAMFNMMVAVGIVPITGQPLPLISKGGTSTIINCAYIGIILSVSRSAKMKKEEGETAPAVALQEA